MARILICEQDPMARTMLEHIVINCGHEVCGKVTDGQEAIDTYQELHPDLVIIDVALPVVNGIEALKRIRSIDGDARALICGAMFSATKIFEADQYGAKDWIAMPFQTNAIQESITKALA